MPERRGGRRSRAVVSPIGVGRRRYVRAVEAEGTEKRTMKTMTNKIPMTVALVAFAICAFPAAGAATTSGNAQVSAQLPNPSCWTTAYGVLTQNCNSDPGFVYLWPTTQVTNTYANVTLDVYSGPTPNGGPIACWAVATYSDGGTYFNPEEVSVGWGWQTMGYGGSTKNPQAYIGSTALYLQCLVPMTSSIAGWHID
jgi:hypothetical protein